MTEQAKYEPVVTRLPEALEAERPEREAAEAALAAAERQRAIDEQAEAERQRAEAFRRSHS